MVLPHRVVVEDVLTEGREKRDASHKGFFRLLKLNEVELDPSALRLARNPLCVHGVLEVVTCHGNVVGNLLSIHDLNTAYEILCVGAVRAYYVLSADDLNVWDYDSVAEFPETPMCEDVAIVEYHPYGCSLF